MHVVFLGRVRLLSVPCHQTLFFLSPFLVIFKAISIPVALSNPIFGIKHFYLGPPSGPIHFEVPTTNHLNNGAQSSQQRQVDTSRAPTAAVTSAMRNQNEVFFIFYSVLWVLFQPGDQLLASRLLNPRSEIPSQPQPQLHAPQLSNGILPLVSGDLLNLKPVNESISLSTSLANFSHNNGKLNFCILVNWKFWEELIIFL